MQALIQWQTVIDSGAGVPSPIDKSSDIYWYDLGCLHVSGICRRWHYRPAQHAGVGRPEPRQQLRHTHGIRAWRNQSATRWIAGKLRTICRDSQSERDGVSFRSRAGASRRCQPSTKSITGEVLRYPKDNHCFVGEDVPKDNVAVPSEDFAYCSGNKFPITPATTETGKGRNGRGYPKRQIIKALDHLFSAFEKQGVRWDNVKSLDPSLIRDIWNSSGAHQNLWGVAEFWSSDVAKLLWWLDRVEWKSSLFDFPLAFECRNAFNHSGGYNMANFQWVGLYQKAPFNTVTYCNSHDFDRSANRLIFNMATAYALILGLEGLPCLYAKDYLERFGGYGLDEKIKNCLYQRYFLGQGSTLWRWTSHDVIAWERMGSGDAPGCLYAINNSPGIDIDFIGVHTKWRGCWLHDYSGHRPDVWADDNGYSVIGAPKRQDAFNAVCYAPHGWEGRNIPVHGGPTTQRFEGAGDLRIAPATPAGSHVMRIWCDANKPIHLNKTEGDGVRFSVRDESGNDIVPRGNWAGQTKQKGWHSITAFSMSVPTAYIVDCTYMAPRGL
jgi:hypothetical protein